MIPDFNGCPVYIYNSSGKLLAKTTVVEHNTANSAINVSFIPELQDQSKYNLLILSNPSPYAFSCVSVVNGDLLTLLLIEGDVREQRSDSRYEMNVTVSVIAYLFEAKAYRLLSPLKAVLVNISKGGIRLRMKPNSLSIDDMIHVSLDIGDKRRILSAHVVNLNNADDYAEYGFELLAL